MTVMMIMMMRVRVMIIPCESVHLKLSCGKRFLPLVKLEAHLDKNYDDDDDLDFDEGIDNDDDDDNAEYAHRAKLLNSGVNIKNL